MTCSASPYAGPYGSYAPIDRGYSGAYGSYADVDRRYAGVQRGCAVTRGLIATTCLDIGAKTHIIHSNCRKLVSCP